MSTNVIEVVVPVCVHGVMKAEQCLWCEAPCRRCGHSWTQHHKGPVHDDYCRHCPCTGFQEQHSPEQT